MRAQSSDVARLERARAALGTTRVTETIHRALEEAVNRKQRTWLAAHDFSGLTDEVIDSLRAPRVFGATAEPRSS